MHIFLQQMNYPEIEKLNDLYLKHRFSSELNRSQILDNKSYYSLVRFELSGKNFELFVDDEYDDFRHNNPVLNLCLVLRELEGYECTSDFQTWCQERSIDSTDEEVKESFNHLVQVYREVEKILGTIDSQVSDFDFELNAGAAQSLRKELE